MMFYAHLILMFFFVIIPCIVGGFILVGETLRIIDFISNPFKK